jgi:hypothetical protein
MMTTWSAELAKEMRVVGDPGPVVAFAPNETAFAEEFNDGFGGTNGRAVLAWTETRVYFPACYDGSEWIASAPRHPTPSAEGHIGGG